MTDKPKQPDTALTITHTAAEQLALGLAVGWIDKDKDEFFRISGMEATKIIEILRNLSRRLAKHG